MTFLWATRGRTWGFRLLRTGGLDDPLPTYEAAFDGAAGDDEVWQATDAGGALRFPDPLGRRDRSGRVIPQDFVVLGDDAAGITSVEEGRRRLWPEVQRVFAEAYDSPVPPTPRP